MENKNGDFNNLNQDEIKKEVADNHPLVGLVYNKAKKEPQPYNYGRAPVDEGVGCSPKVASGCALIGVIIFVIGLVVAFLIPIFFKIFR